MSKLSAKWLAQNSAAKRKRNSVPIPTDILLAIIPYLAPAQLAICARASRLFYEIVTPLFYRSVYINMDRNVNALFRRRHSPFARHTRVAQALGKMGMGQEKIWAHDEVNFKGVRGTLAEGESRITGGISDDFIHIDKPLPPYRFQFVTSLTITAHNRTLCSNLPPLIMPSLRDLRIRPGLHQTHFDLCQCVHFFFDFFSMAEMNGRCCNTLTPCVCPLISLLRPRRLLIGDDTTGLSGSGMGLDPISHLFNPALKEIVVFVGACTGFEIMPQAYHTWLDCIPATVEKLTLVMQPREDFSAWEKTLPQADDFSVMLSIRRRLWRAPNGRWRFKDQEGEDGRICGPRYLWILLSKALMGKAGMLEVVGLETIDNDWTEMTIEEAEARLREALRYELANSSSCSEADAEDRSQRIKFMSRREFDARP